MPKGINSLVFFDFETGGLECQKHAVTEVAAFAIKGDTMEKIDLMSTFVKPYGKVEYDDTLLKEIRQFDYDPIALKATGITMEDILSGKELKEVCEEFLTLLKTADYNPRNKGSKPVLIAHNAGFDAGFMTQIMEHTGNMKEFSKLVYGKEDYYGNFQPVMLDTIILSKMAWGHDEDMSNFKLASCMAKAGVDLADAHRAINDTIGMKDMVRNLINKLRSDGSGGEQQVKKVRFRNHFHF